MKPDVVSYALDRIPEALPQLQDLVPNPEGLAWKHRLYRLCHVCGVDALGIEETVDVRVVENQESVAGLGDDGLVEANLVWPDVHLAVEEHSVGNPHFDESAPPVAQTPDVLRLGWRNHPL